MNRKLQPCKKFSRCKASGNFKPVQSGLSMTPSDIRKLTDRGIAVTASNKNVDAGDVEAPYSYDVDYTFTRDADINGAWEREQLAKGRIMKLNKKSKTVIKDQKNVQSI